MTSVKNYKYKSKIKHKYKKNFKSPYFIIKKKIQLNEKNDKTSCYTVDFKNTKFLQSFLSLRNAILPKKITKLTSNQQRQITKAIKISRIGGLLPFNYNSIHYHPSLFSKTLDIMKKNRFKRFKKFTKYTKKVK